MALTPRDHLCSATFPATAPSTRNVGTECGLFVFEHKRSVTLRQDLRAASMNEKRCVPRGQEGTGAGVPGSGSGAPCKSRSSPPPLVVEPAQTRTLDDGAFEAW
jgi:hypothetical protein